MFQLPITNVAIRQLLLHYKWNSQQLIIEYFELGDEAFFQRAHVTHPYELLATNNADQNNSNGCTICYDDDANVSIMISKLIFILDKCKQCKFEKKNF